MAGYGFKVYSLDYFTAPLNYDGNFDFCSYFQQFISIQSNLGELDPSNLIFVGYGLGGTCALTLSAKISPIAIIAVNPISNLTRILTKNNDLEVNGEERAQINLWNNRIQNYGYSSFFKELEESKQMDFVPILHVSNIQSNTTLIIRSLEDAISITRDESELLERIHCESWEMAGNGKILWFDNSFFDTLVEWLGTTTALDLEPRQNFSSLILLTQVPVFCIICCIIVLVLLQHKSIQGEDDAKSNALKTGLKMDTREKLYLLFSMGGIGGLLLMWGNLSNLLLINLIVNVLIIVSFYVSGKRQALPFKKRHMDEPSAPLTDLAISLTIIGVLFIAFFLAASSLFIPHVRNLPYMILFGLEWGGFYCINLVTVANLTRNPSKRKELQITGIFFNLFTTFSLLMIWDTMNNPLLSMQLPIVFASFGGLFFIVSILPYFTPRPDLISLFFPIFLIVWLF